MIRMVCAVCCGLVALVLAGCSTLKVQQDWAENADFVQYRDFLILDLPQTANELVARRIRDAVQATLIERGFIENQDDPDFLVAIHGEVKDRVDVQTYNYSYPVAPYGMSPYWHGGHDVSVSQYEEGTLVIDFVDAQKKELFWRGWGTQIVDERTRSPEVLREIVEKIVAQFPPE